MDSTLLLLPFILIHTLQETVIIELRCAFSEKSLVVEATLNID